MAHNKNDIPDSKLYTIIKVIRNEDLYQQIGRDVYFDLVDTDKVRSFRVLESTPFKHFKKVVAGQFGVSVKLQRFWLWAERENQTYRPDRPLTQEEETQPVAELNIVQTKDGKLEVILFLEIVQNVHTLRQVDKTGEDILLFFKLYDPEKEEIRYVGKISVKGGGMPGDILGKLNEMANFALDAEIILFEEIMFVPAVMCELVDKENTFLNNQLQNGDIICFHKEHPVQMKCRYPDIPSFLGYIFRWQRLQETKLKVIETKDKLKKAEENMAPLQLKVISLNGKLKEVEENMVPLHIKVRETKDVLKAIEKELKEAEENVAASKLKATLIENELKEAEEHMEPLQLKADSIKDELKEAEDHVAALEAMINHLSL